MIASMILSGGPYNQIYNLMSPTSKVQLEKGWSDPMGQRSAAVIERDPYTDVLTTLPIQIVGSSEVDAWNQYNKFASFVQYIAQFRLHPDRHPITFGIKATAASSLVSTLATGSADYNPATPIISQPPPAILDDVSGMYRMRGIKVQFRRKGRFIRPNPDDQSAEMGITNTPVNGRESKIIFGEDYDTDSPVTLSIGLEGTSSTMLPGGQILVSNPYVYSETFAGEAFQFINGRHLGTSAPLGFSAVVDSILDTNPMTLGSSLLSKWVAPNNTPVEKTGNPGITTLFREFLCLALVRSQVSQSAATMQFFLQSTLDSTRIYSKVMPIVAGADAKVINLGVMGVPEGWANAGFLIGVIYRNTSTTLSTIWLDTFILVNLNVANLSYFEHGPIWQPAGYIAYAIDQRYLSATTPIMYMNDGSDIYAYPSRQRGSMHVNRRGRSLRVLWLTPGGNKWRQHAHNRPITVGAESYPASLSASGV
jgi:hypothetical protein